MNEDDRDPYQKAIDELTSSKASREQIVDFLKQTNDEVFDLDAQPKPKHKWVDRGLKMSCEGAGHPMHQSWKVKR